MLYGIASATAALFLAALLTALLRVPALRLGVVDRRRQRRVPLCGGVAVVLSTGLVASAGRWSGVAPLGDGIGGPLLAGAAVAALGLVADVRRVKLRFLAGGTAVAAAWVVPYGELGLLGGVAGAGWIVFVALGFRSLDHADGLAGTVGVVTAFGVGVLAVAEVRDGSAVLLSVLAAALTGFLMHNRPPARAGLGSCGALFAGFVLAAVALSTRAGHEPAAGAGVLFALTAIAGADVILVLLSRRLAGRPLTRGGPDHLAHRLRRLGLTARGATVVLGAGSCCGVLVAVLVHLGWIAGSGVYWVAAGTAAVVLGLLRVRVYGVVRRGVHATATTSARPLGRPRSPVTSAGASGRTSAGTSVRTSAGAFSGASAGTAAGASGRTSAGTSVRTSAGAFAGASAGTAAGASGRTSAGTSVRTSAGAFSGASAGTAARTSVEVSTAASTGAAIAASTVTPAVTRPAAHADSPVSAPS